MTEKIGFIGLGIMGRPMALNLRKAGYDLWVYARRAEMTKPLVEAGATACQFPCDVAERADITVVMVSDTPDVEQVILGKHGAIEGATEGDLIIDMSSIAALATRHIATQLAEKGVHMLDAPVSGGDKGAIAGTLSIMIGGKAEQVERAMSLFKALGQNIVHIGDHGAGQITKTCNQMLITQTMMAVGETFLLAKAAGVNPANVRDALLGGFAGSRVLEIHGQRMLEHNFEPGFKLQLHHKDIKIVLQTIAELGLAMPGTATASQFINTLMGMGQGELDSTAMVLAQERLNDVYLADNLPTDLQRDVS